MFQIKYLDIINENNFDLNHLNNLFVYVDFCIPISDRKLTIKRMIFDIRPVFSHVKIRLIIFVLIFQNSFGKVMAALQVSLCQHSIFCVFQPKYFWKSVIFFNSCTYVYAVI